MKAKTVVLCSSVSFYKELMDIEKNLLKLGFQVEVPVSARKMEQAGDFTMKGQKAWITDPSKFHIKTELMDAHFKKVEEGDAILVVNLDKNGIEGYIGGNVLMEMTVAYFLKKPIYIWKKVGVEHPFYEEIMGVGAIFLDENLKKIV